MLTLGVLWTLLFWVVQFFIKEQYFRGIQADDVTCVSSVQQITYEVTAIKQITLDDNSVSYRITMKDVRKDNKDNSEVSVANDEEVEKTEIAPVFTLDLVNIPSDMDLGVQYAAQWLRVTGIYKQYSCVKDSISMQFSQETIDNTALQNLKADVTQALVAKLSTVIKDMYVFVVIIGIIIYFIGGLLISRLSIKLTDKLFVATDIDYIQQDLDKIHATHRPVPTVSTVEQCTQSLQDFIKKAEQRKKPKELITDKMTHNANGTSETIDVQQNVKLQLQEVQKKRAAHRLKAVTDDIHYDTNK
jgi:hypothetical protein